MPSSRPPAALHEPPTEGATARTPAWAPWLRWLAAIGWAVLVLALARSLSPSIYVDPKVAFLSGFGAVAISAVVTAALCPPIHGRALIGVIGPAGALLALSLRPLPELPGALIVTASLPVGASLVGGAVGRAIEHPGQLVFVAIVSSAADVASVFHPSGPSAVIAQSPAALSLVALPWPMLGTPSIAPLLGAGDVVFTALYLASTRRHGLSVRRTVLALCCAYAATAGAVLVLEQALPALPLLGLALVIAQPAARRPRRADMQRGLVLAGTVIAVVTALLWLGH